MAGREREKEGERSGLLPKMEKRDEEERRKRGKELLGLRQNGVVLLVQNDVVWLSEKFEFCRHERPVVRSHETTRRFLLIRTTSRSIRTNDTPFDHASERKCV